MISSTNVLLPLIILAAFILQTICRSADRPIISFLKVPKTDLNEAFTCLHSCDLQAIRVWYKTEIGAPKIWHGPRRYRDPRAFKSPHRYLVTFQSRFFNGIYIFFSAFLSFFFRDVTLLYKELISLINYKINSEF